MTQKFDEARKALKMATINGSKALDFQDQIGSLKPGKKADIAVINLKKPHMALVYDLIIALVYFAHTSDVETVIVDGKIVVENYKIKTLDEEKTLTKAQARIDELGNKIDIRLRDSYPVCLMASPASFNELHNPSVFLVYLNGMKS